MAEILEDGTIRWNRMAYSVAKMNKRLCIIDQGARRIYTPPEFIRKRIANRAQLQALADQLTMGHPYIDAVQAFETSLRADDLECTRDRAQSAR